MNLHDKIMNLAVTGAAITEHKLAYKYGHRDARHAAAELAIEHDSELEKALSERDTAEHVCGTYLTRIDEQAALVAQLVRALELAYRSLNGGSDTLTPMEHDKAFKLGRAALAAARGEVGE